MPASTLANTPRRHSEVLRGIYDVLIDRAAFLAKQAHRRLLVFYSLGTGNRRRFLAFARNNGGVGYSRRIGVS